MAFGDLKGTFAVAQNSITNPTDTGTVASGSGVVVVGDLVYVLIAEQTGISATGVSDNLGNTYSIVQTGTDAGTATGVAYYSRITTAGTITNIAVAASGSTRNVVVIAAIIEGPFATSPVDANPTNITSDVSSPFTCPSTGTLALANEVVIGWGVATGNASWAATSPNLLATQLATAAVLKAAIGYQAVTSTTAVAPDFTGTNPTECVLGTTSFKATPTAFSLSIETGSYTISIADEITFSEGDPTGWRAQLSFPVRRAIVPAMAIALGASGLFSPPIVPDATESDTIEWLRPLSEPQRQPSGIKPHLQQSYTTDIFQPPAPVVEWWLSPFSEPTRSAPGLGASSHSFMAYGGMVTEVLSLGPPWAIGEVPIGGDRSATEGQSFHISLETGAYVISIADDVTFSGLDSIGWFKSLAEPIRPTSWINSLPSFYFVHAPSAGTAFSITIETGTYTITGATSDFIFDNEGWRGQFSEPVRSKAALPAHLQQSFSTSFFFTAPEIDVDGWFRQLSEPLRLKGGLHPSLQPFVAADTAAIPTSRIRWHSPFTEPVRQKSRLHPSRQPFFTTDTVAIPTSKIRWFTPLSEPTPPKRALSTSLQSTTTQDTKTPTAADVSVSAWHGWLSEPRRFEIGLRADLQQSFTSDITPLRIDGRIWWFSPLAELARQKQGLHASLQSTTTRDTEPPEPFDVSVAAWYGWLNEPQRFKAGLRTDLQRSFTSDVTPLRIDGRLWWLSPWSEPQRQKIGLRHDLQQSFSTDLAIIRTDGLWWLYPYSEPVRIKPALSPHHHQYLAYVGAATQNAPNNNFAEESYFSKYSYPWSEPVRQKIGLGSYLHQFYVNDYELIPTPPPIIAYASAFAEPVRYPEGLKHYLQSSFAYHPRLLPTPDVTATLDAVEINEDVALIGISVYDGGAPGAAASAQVSIIEIPSGVSAGGVATARVSVIEVPPEAATATVSVIEIVAGDGSVSIQEV